MLKIFHTGDIHIGMKFSGYPDNIREQLIEARFETLEKMIKLANEEHCNIFAVAGDLFEKISIPKRDIVRVVNILEKFSGDCVLVLPGNHDYDNGMVDLWKLFKGEPTDKILVLNEPKVYDLNSFDLDVAVYPAFCDKKHSHENNLKWISQAATPEAKFKLGMAHGALEGLSPDMKQEYFYMSKQELETLPVDLWLLGHTHIPYPNQAEVSGQRIFNAGTPEPDGLDCSHEGSAWLLEIDDNSRVKAQRIKTGTYEFIDHKVLIESEESFVRTKAMYITENAKKTILRLTLEGRIEPELFSRKDTYYRELDKLLGYLKINDSKLGIKITGQIIDQEFTVGSFPHQLLSELVEDEEALQIAYEIIQEVKAV